MAEILLVDDDLVALKVLRNVLVGAGHTVICARDGERALAVLEDNPEVDLLVTDVLMPRLDGRELVATLRRHPTHAALPAIIMSGTVRISEIVKLLEEGAHRFLAKPVQPARLLEEVGACLNPPSDPTELLLASD